MDTTQTGGAMFGTAVGVASLAGGYLLYRWGVQEEARLARRFDTDLLRDAADVLARHLGREHPEVRAALGEWVRTGDRPDALARVLGVEYRVTDPGTAGGEWVRTVRVLLAGPGGNGRLAEVARSYPEAALPRPIRERFFGTAADALTFPVVSAGGRGQ